MSKPHSPKPRGAKGSKRPAVQPGTLTPWPSARSHGAFQLIPWEPSAERAVVFMRVLFVTLAATFVTAVAVSLTPGTTPTMRWGLVLAAMLVGLAPWLWHALGSRRGLRLTTWDLAPGLAQQVAKAAEQADQLRRMADRSPDGPVAEHLAHLATTAEGYVIMLHQAASRASSAASGGPLGGDGSGDADLERDMARIVAQLSDLTEAAHRLRQVQQHHLETSPLEELTEATNRLTGAIEAGLAPLDGGPPDEHRPL